MPFYRLPIDTSPVRGRGPNQGGFELFSNSAYDADALLLFDRFSGIYSQADKDAANEVITGLRSDSVWSKLFVLRIYAAPNSADALLNWKSSSFNATLVNSPTFTVDRGFSNLGVNSQNGATATRYLQSNFVPSTDGWTTSSGSYGVWTSTNVAEENNFRYVMGGTSTTGGTFISRMVLRGPSNSFNPTIMGVSVSNSSTDSTGLSSISRNGASDTRIFKGGSQVGTTSTSSATGVTSVQLFIGCENSNGTPNGGTHPTRVFNADFIGAGLSTTDIASINSRLQTYMTYKGV